ncbi:DUF2478 domain-containing protein [Azospirillum sp. B4]|uniref:DUF2478 domain-containing protein n=1 Tax=Azospirillum sp. B4 TaxID=95605 RepID=UPI0003484797|nr:DUF2478 domain-containing protein [Azospirillum sp. B4]
MPDSVAYTQNLLNLAAVIYQPADDVDRMLATFAEDLRAAGHAIGGIIQRNIHNACGPVTLMEVVDLRTDRVIPICQNLGPGSTSCRLNQAGLADAAQAVSQAIGEGVELIIINKFGKTEAEGGGLRAELAAAIGAGLPVLTAVPERFYGAWLAFTGGYGTTLLCDGAIIADWWNETSRWAAARRRAGEAGA